MSAARQIAADILMKLERDQAYSALSIGSVLSSEPGLSVPDAALVTRLV